MSSSVQCWSKTHYTEYTVSMRVWYITNCKLSDPEIISEARQRLYMQSGFASLDRNIAYTCAVVSIKHSDAWADVTFTWKATSEPTEANQ
jgi:hypothetical protein